MQEKKICNKCQSKKNVQLFDTGSYRKKNYCEDCLKELKIFLKVKKRFKDEFHAILEKIFAECESEGKVEQRKNKKMISPDNVNILRQLEVTWCVASILLIEEIIKDEGF